MNELRIIEQREVLGKEFKIYGDFENPLFLAKDVAEWIDYDLSSINKMLNGIDEAEKGRKIVPTLGGNQEAWFLTEDGVYETLMQSRKPIAKQFKKKVKEILRDIRKHGLYVNTETLESMLNNPDMMIAMLNQYKKEKEAVEALQLEVRQLGQVVGELRPKANYVDTILQSKSLVNVNQISKDYGMSARIFNQLLYKLGVQYKQGGQWLLYSKHQSCGYTHSETFQIERSDGRPDVVMRTRWTQKGRLFLYDLLKQNGCIPMIEKRVS